jgi:glutaredoxin
MVLFSGYLMYIMWSKFVVPLGVKGVCYFCLASAVSAAAMFILTLIGREWEDRGQLAFLGVIVGMVTLVGTLAIYAPIGKPSGGGLGEITSGDGTVFFTVKSTSGQAEMALAQHLKQSGAKMYGAYWCPHCYEQKELLGQEAAKEILYVECAQDGKNSQTDLCMKVAEASEKQTGQKFGFPTWEIDGKFYPGRQTLQELAKHSGYTGPQNFKNQF